MFVDNKILQLKLRDDGCPFLGPNGCLIFNCRPSLCRLFPFNYEIRKGKVILEFEKSESINSEDCSIIEKHFNTENAEEALIEMNEEINDFKEFVKGYDKELDLYLKYAPLINKGVSFEVIIKKLGIRV
jgi:Fe-S-cluster containining protein